MKEANLISVLNAFKSLNQESFNSYLGYHSIKIKNDELQDLEVLLENLKGLNKNITLFDKYFIGYSIPQIGKEFDLLRMDSETVLNIELKKKSTEVKIRNQLLRNKYYLSGYYHEPDPSIIIQIDHPKLMSASIPERVSFRL